VILSGCSYFRNSKDEVYVARIDDKTYLLKDLRSQLPAGMTKPDSLARVNDILTRWVKKELLLKMAIENRMKVRKISPKRSKSTAMPS